MTKAQAKGSQFIGEVFYYQKLDENGSGGDLVTSYAKTDTPVKILDTARHPSTLGEGIIKRIHYRINPTNAVTYTLRLYRHAIAGDYNSNMAMLYESAAARADDTDYDVAEIEIPFILDSLGKIYFALEWTGAPGLTLGFIEVSGVVLK